MACKNKKCINKDKSLQIVPEYNSSLHSEGLYTIREDSIPIREKLLKNSIINQTHNSNKLNETPQDTASAIRKPIDKLALASGISFYSGLAIGSISNLLGLSTLVIGLASGVMALGGLIMAIIAMRKIKRNGFQKRGFVLSKSVVIVFSIFIILGVISALTLAGILK
ncbi:MAG: hypothetical protein IT245_09180 [Bacteroidia bacterium]|nr:hypothetical protein [Bacteroidia bacterium]